MASVLPELAANRAVSLPELLTSRECRQARQQAWLAQHQSTLLVLTLVVPGAVKDSALTRNIFNLGWQALQQMWASRVGTACRPKRWRYRLAARVLWRCRPMPSG